MTDYCSTSQPIVNHLKICNNKCYISIRYALIYHNAHYWFGHADSYHIQWIIDCKPTNYGNSNLAGL